MADLLLASGRSAGDGHAPALSPELAAGLASDAGWQVRLAEGTHGVVEAFARQPADLVAVDLDGLGTSGLGLLTALAEHHPHTARVALTARRSSPAVARAASLAHRVLNLPVPIEVLRAALADVLQAHRRPTSERLAAVIGGTRSLPTAPVTWVRLSACLADERAGAVEAADVVADDPALTVKLLQVVNSAYFGLGRTISSVREAVAMLGCEAVRSLVLAFEAFPLDRPVVAGISPGAVRQHGLACATLAQRLVPAGRAAQDAFTGALVQDVGLWVLAEGCPGDLAANVAEARAAGVALHQVELARLGVTHAEVGAHLLGLWGLPQPVLDAVAGSHDPLEPIPTDLGPADAVRIAHAVVQHREPGAADPTEPPGDGNLPPAALALLDRAAS